MLTSRSSIIFVPKSPQIMCLRIYSIVGWWKDGVFFIICEIHLSRNETVAQVQEGKLKEPPKQHFTFDKSELPDLWKLGTSSGLYKPH